MKRGTSLDALVLDALRDLAEADHARHAHWNRDDALEDAPKANALHETFHRAQERVRHLAMGLFPAKPPRRARSKRSTS